MSKGTERSLAASFCERWTQRSQKLAAKLLFFMLLAAVFVRATNTPIYHLDTWDHWKYGEWIWQHRQLPDREPFTPAFSDQSKPLVDTMWLSQMIGYLVYSRAGMEGIALLYGLIEVLKTALYYVAYRRISGSPWLALIGVVLVQASLWSYFGVLRPQTLGEVCWAAVLALVGWVESSRPTMPTVGLEDSTHPTYWSLATLPLVFALWANLHGSFILGLVVLGILFVNRCVTTWRIDKQLALLLLFSTVATCANPYGPRLLREVLNFRNNPTLQQAQEWAPMLPLATYGAKALVASILFVLLTARFSPRRFSVADVILLTLFGLAAWFSARMLPWWMTLWPWVVLPHWAAILDKETRRQGDKETRRSLPLLVSLSPCLLVSLSCCVSLSLLAFSGSVRWLIYQHPRPIEEQVTTVTPVELVQPLRDWIGDREVRVFAPYQWCDYLLWQLPPSAQLFWYTHYEAFPAERLRHQMRISMMRPAPNDWRSLLDHYQLDVLALSDDAPGRALFAHFLHGKEPGWRVIYTNADATRLIAVRAP